MLRSVRTSILCAAILVAGMVNVSGAETAAGRGTLSGANLVVGLNFSTANSDVISLTAADPVAAGTSLANVTVTVTIGTVTQNFTLDSTGTSGSSGASSIGIVNNQVIVGLQGSFATAFPTFQNANVTAMSASLPVTLQFGSVTTAQATLSGTYSAVQGTAGTFTSGTTGITGGTGGIPGVAFTSFTATPNPANVGQALTFTVTFTGLGKANTGTHATLDPGDGTAPITLADSDRTSATTGQAQYTYTTAGAFLATLTITGPSGSVSTSTFVVVGQNTDVNSTNGLASTATVRNGSATISINAAQVPAAVSASTVFSDATGPTTLAETRDASASGFIFARSYTAPTMTVATTTALDATGAPVGMVRKMFAVSSRDVNDPSALPLPPSSSISKVKMTGKFVFSPSKPDQVAFSGSVQLPAGFNPSASGGNVFVVGMGNVVGSVMVDSKGKPMGSVSAPLKSVSIKYPKLAGQAVGGETATLTATLAAPNLSQLGFDTEGITQKLRPDEAAFKSVNRFIQTSFLLGGVKYEGYIPVTYKLAKGGASGSIGARSGN